MVIITRVKLPLFRSELYLYTKKMGKIIVASFKGPNGKKSLRLEFQTMTQLSLTAFDTARVQTAH